MLLKEIASDVHCLAKSKGWWESEREVGTMIALIHSELSEALEAHRGDVMSDKIPGFLGIEEEMADAVIRIMDMCEGMGWRLDEAIVAKHEYNKTRSHRHGNKKF